MENNVYQAPESTLLNSNGDNDITQMKRFSAWGVFGLSVITLGIYPIYWLYNRAESINQFHSNQISKNLINSFLVVALSSFAIGLIPFFAPENAMFAGLSTLTNIAYMVLYLVLLFTIRNRLNDIIGTKINGILTFFLNAIYLQYRINKAIDES